MTELPPIAETDEQVKQHLQEFGFARIADALSREELDEARERLVTQARREEEMAGCGMAPAPTRPMSRASES